MADPILHETANLPADWASQVLTGLGVKPTPGAIAVLEGMSAIERGAGNLLTGGGSDTGAGALNNPFDSTGSQSGSVSMNSVGVEDYPTWAEGLKASISLLKQNNYSGVFKALKAGDTDAGLQAYAKVVDTWQPGFSSSAPYTDMYKQYSGGKLPPAIVGNTTNANTDLGNPNPTPAKVVGKTAAQAAAAAAKTPGGATTTGAYATSTVGETGILPPVTGSSGSALLTGEKPKASIKGVDITDFHGYDLSGIPKNMLGNAESAIEEYITKPGYAAQLNQRITEDFGYSGGWIQKIPQLNAILIWAATTLDPSTAAGVNMFLGAISNTTWWKTNTQNQRAFQEAQSQDPATAQNAINQAAAKVLSVANQLGVTLSDTQIRSIAHMYASMAFTPTGVLGSESGVGAEWLDQAVVDTITNVQKTGALAYGPNGTIVGGGNAQVGTGVNANAGGLQGARTPLGGLAGSQQSTFEKTKPNTLFGASSDLYSQFKGIAQQYGLYSPNGVAGLMSDQQLMDYINHALQNYTGTGASGQLTAFVNSAVTEFQNEMITKAENVYGAENPAYKRAIAEGYTPSYLGIEERTTATPGTETHQGTGTVQAIYSALLAKTGEYLLLNTPKGYTNQDLWNLAYQYIGNAPAGLSDIASWAEGQFNAALISKAQQVFASGDSPQAKADYAALGRGATPTSLGLGTPGQTSNIIAELYSSLMQAATQYLLFSKAGAGVPGGWDPQSLLDYASNEVKAGYTNQDAMTWINGIVQSFTTQSLMPAAAKAWPNYSADIYAGVLPTTLVLPPTGEGQSGLAQQLFSDFLGVAQTYMLFSTKPGNGMLTQSDLVRAATDAVKNWKGSGDWSSFEAEQVTNFTNQMKAQAVITYADIPGIKDAIANGWTPSSLLVNQTQAGGRPAQPGNPPGTRAPVPQTPGAPAMGGVAAELYQNFQQTAQEYLLYSSGGKGGYLTQQDIMNAVNQVLRSAPGTDPSQAVEGAEANWEQTMKQKAAQVYPSLAAAISQGTTPQSYVQPEQNLIASTLGLNASAVNFTSPQWSWAIATPDAKTGQKVALTSDQILQKITSPNFTFQAPDGKTMKYANTNNAIDTAKSLTAQLAQMFGMGGAS